MISEFLTSSRKKRDLFCKDIYFREGWKHLEEKWPSENERESKLWRMVPVIFKPEAVLSRNISCGLELIQDLPLVPVFSSSVRYNRHSIRAAWQYQINKATSERLEAMDLLLQAAEGFYVLFLVQGDNLSRPAIVDFNEVKGPADPREREGKHFRKRIPGVQDNLVNYFHSVDEPADIVREIAVLFSESDRRKLLDSVDCGVDISENLPNVVDSIYSRNCFNDFNLDESIFHVENAVEVGLRGVGGNRGCELERYFRECFIRLREGERGLWLEIKSRIDELGIQINYQDHVTISCLTTVMHREGEKAILPSTKFNGSEHFGVFKS